MAWVFSVNWIIVSDKFESILDTILYSKCGIDKGLIQKEAQ
jgi:hypothetical protein